MERRLNSQRARSSPSESWSKAARHEDAQGGVQVRSHDTQRALELHAGEVELADED